MPVAGRTRDLVDFIVYCQHPQQASFPGTRYGYGEKDCTEKSRIKKVGIKKVGIKKVGIKKVGIEEKGRSVLGWLRTNWHKKESW